MKGPMPARTKAKIAAKVKAYWKARRTERALASRGPGEPELVPVEPLYAVRIFTTENGHLMVTSAEVQSWGELVDLLHKQTGTVAEVRVVAE